MRIAFAILLLAFAGCTRPAEGEPPALPLPAPAAMGEPRVADHLVVAQFGGRALSCRGLFRVTAERVELVCLDAMGQRALALDWSAAGARLTAAPPGFDLAVNLIAGEIAAMFAPEAALEAAYARAGWSITHGATERLIARDGRVIIRIGYTPDAAGRWSGRTVLSNLVTGHRIDVQSRFTTPIRKAAGRSR